METSSSPPADDNAPAKPEIKCLYTKACDTGSQPRKAISHIFGRNKMCTRMIPQHVWVHFCRKHYQRSRYRNAQEYAKVQCELVEKQVARVQSWSDDNRRAGQGDVVVDWSLSMRKREQTRVQEQAHKKRTSGQESEDDTGMDRAVLNGTAVPDWLRNKVGDGYSTDEIQQIVLRLKEEVEQNNMSQIPDIEILPNITDIQDAPIGAPSLPEMLYVPNPNLYLAASTSQLTIYLKMNYEPHQQKNVDESMASPH
ncbi:putative orp1 like protein [Eutypa lata UCREL1]|uniref:Putative orp1 like protein n=1 Tax=Eutypa lata (strain UCR-EL1) TaxID=1287681 RepID=M7SZY6_EUTLA|nr:putative orp1 like protein [Eutypa lata UCREL1]